MQIPSHPMYDITEDGTVTLISTGTIVPQFLNRRNKRAVKIRGKNHKVSSQSIDRLILRTFCPIKDEEIPDLEYWTSIRYKDGNFSNLHLSNLEWDDSWYTPPGVVGVTHPLGTWFDIPEFPNHQITFVNEWMIRRKKDFKFCPIKTLSGYAVANIDAKTVVLARLIALTFLPHPKDTDLILPDHRDSDKTNDAISNLSWVTHSENLQASYDKGGNRESDCKRIVLMNIETGVIVKHPSINAVARFLGTNPGMVHGLITHRKSRGRGYKGFLIKTEDDPTPWVELLSDTEKNYKPYEIAVRDYSTGKITIYSSLMETIRCENINAKTVYRLLANDVIEPWNGKCIQAYNPDGMSWPDYPPEVMEAWSKRKNTGKPLKITCDDGTIEYSSGVTEWCNADRENRCDPAVLSRVLKYTSRWRRWTFDYIRLEDYNTFN